MTAALRDTAKRRTDAANKQAREREDLARLAALVRDAFNAAQGARRAGADLDRLDKHLAACAAACGRARARLWLARSDTSGTQDRSL